MNKNENFDKINNFPIGNGKSLQKAFEASIGKIKYYEIYKYEVHCCSFKDLIRQKN